MEKKAILVFTFLFAMSIIAKSQVNTSIINQKTFGGNNMDYPSSGVVCLDGSYVIGGTSLSSNTGDKTDPGRGMQDYWIVKYDPSLSVVWQKTFGGSGGDILYSLIATSDGGFLCGGISTSPISGDKTVANNGISDFWVMKLDSNGDIEWQKTYGGSSSNSLSSILDLNDGNFILAGVSSSPISGDKTENSRGGNDYWVLKINSVGTKIWDKTIGGTDNDNLTNTILISPSEIILSGTSLSNSSSEKTENSYGEQDVWVVKMDTSGTILWDRTVGGSLEDYIGSVEVLNNEIYVISQSFSDLSGTKTENSIGESDYWVTKLNANGNILWDKTIGGDWFDIPSSITATADGQLLLSGYSWSGVSGDKTEPSKGLYDYWLVSINPNGTILWQKTIGGSNMEELSLTLEVSSNHYILIGNSESNISGDKTENSRGNKDFWIVEITTTLNINEHNDNLLSVYPNPSSNYFIINFSDATKTGTLLLYDNFGKLVKKVSVQNNTEINIEEMARGMYYGTLQLDNHQHTFKILKQ